MLLAVLDIILQIIRTFLGGSLCDKDQDCLLLFFETNTHPIHNSRNPNRLFGIPDCYVQQQITFLIKNQRVEPIIKVIVKC